MSLKNDIEMIKEELNSEEKFFEKAVMTEKFVKKYKKLMIASVVLVVVIVTGDIAYNISEQNRISTANEALLQLEKNPADKDAKSTLEALSPELYSVWQYSQAVVSDDVSTLEKLKNSKALIVNDVAAYEVAQAKNDLQALEAYSENQNAIYKDLAQVEAALILMNQGKTDEAHSKLAMISATSPLAQIAQALKHYGVK
ncbi:tetratricopeptide repeat protein [Sulfurimonas sp.]